MLLNLCFCRTSVTGKHSANIAWNLREKPCSLNSEHVGHMERKQGSQSLSFSSSSLLELGALHKLKEFFLVENLVQP